jgi:hypothetical protein
MVRAEVADRGAKLGRLRLRRIAVSPDALFADLFSAAAHALAEQGKPRHFADTPKTLPANLLPPAAVVLAGP